MPRTNKKKKTSNHNRDSFNTCFKRRGNYYNRYNYYGRTYFRDSQHNNYQRNRLKPKNTVLPEYNNHTSTERSPSPFCGSEEHTLRKIQETSDMIKKQLSMPSKEIHCTILKPKSKVTINESKTKTVGCTSSNTKKTVIEKNQTTNKELLINSDDNKPTQKYNVDEIHDKIINHITNLSHGRKMNLISSNYSGYDSVIQQIQKQKRLELSKALRDMCSNQCVENSNVINSIIPDIGIKIEDLPLEIIQQLSSTLDVNLNDNNKTVSENINESNVEINIKVEPHDDLVIINDNYLSNCSLEIENDNITNIGHSSKDIMTIDTDIELRSVASIATQTDADRELSFENQVKRCKSLDNAISIMFNIDKEIARLTKLRQALFRNKKKFQVGGTCLAPKVRKKLKNKQDELFLNDKETVSRFDEKSLITNNIDTQPLLSTDNSIKTECKTNFHTPINFNCINEKIVVINTIENDSVLVVATDIGKLIFVNLSDGQIYSTIQICQVSITSLSIQNSLNGKTHIYVGSLEKNLKQFDFNRQQQTCLFELLDNVQCMDTSWNYIFIGTSNGYLIRFSLKNYKIECENKVMENCILVLKATQEGARRVLIVGSRFSSVCIRDAMSGLHMRTMFGVFAPTVYSLILEKSLLYCGTTVHNILVYNFNDGHLVNKYEAANSKGIACMKIVNNLLFAGCFNGNIYVYNTINHRYVGFINGPGCVILSMEIVANLVIVGTMSSQLLSFLIPAHFFENL